MPVHQTDTTMSRPINCYRARHLPVRGANVTTAGIYLHPRPVRVSSPKKLHVIKSGDKLHSVRHADTCLVAFLNYSTAHQHRDHLWRSYEATGTFFQEIQDDQCLRLHSCKEAKPVNSDGVTDLEVDDIYFNDLRDICLKNIISLLVVTSISDQPHFCTYHCHKYVPDVNHNQAAGVLDKMWECNVPSSRHSL